MVDGNPTDPVTQPAYVPLKREPVITFFGWGAMAVGVYGLLRLARGVILVGYAMVRQGSPATGMIPAWLFRVGAYACCYALLLTAGILLLRKSRLARAMSLVAGTAMLGAFLFLELRHTLSGWLFMLGRGRTSTVMLRAQLIPWLVLMSTGLLCHFLYPLSLIIGMLTPAVRRALRLPLRCPDDAATCSPPFCDRFVTCERAKEARDEAPRQIADAPAGD